MWGQAGCGGRPGGREDPELRGLMLGPVLADSSLEAFLPESSAVGIADYDRAWKAGGRSDYWLVDYWWFFLPRRPLEFKTFAEMHVMEEKGVIDTSTVVSTIRYRMGIEAVGIEEMRRRASELRPKVPPPSLTQTVERYLDTHEVRKPD